MRGHHGYGRPPPPVRPPPGTGPHTFTFEFVKIHILHEHFCFELWDSKKPKFNLELFSTCILLCIDFDIYLQVWKHLIKQWRSFRSCQTSSRTTASPRTSSNQRSEFFRPAPSNGCGSSSAASGADSCPSTPEPPPRSTAFACAASNYGSNASSSAKSSIRLV